MARRRLVRKSETIEYRPVFVVATEGKETEPRYFGMRLLRRPNISVNLEVLPSTTCSSPISVQKRMDEFIKGYDKREQDEFWLVVDIDHWNDQELQVLVNWASTSIEKNIAISNPCFEYWLLLHFEDGIAINGRDDCVDKLRQYCPHFTKTNIEERKFNKQNIQNAISHAKSQDNPPCITWPTVNGTTIYRLVEKIIIP